MIQLTLHSPFADSAFPILSNAVELPCIRVINAILHHKNGVSHVDTTVIAKFAPHSSVMMGGVDGTANGTESATKKAKQSSDKLQ